MHGSIAGWAAGAFHIAGFGSAFDKLAVADQTDIALRAAFKMPVVVERFGTTFRALNCRYQRFHIIYSLSDPAQRMCAPC